MRNQEDDNMRNLCRIWPLLTIALCACNPTPSTIEESFTMTSTTEEALVTLSKARIFFGHQSVGYNIIAGVEEIQSGTETGKINILELDDRTAYPAAFLLHSRVGKNTDPGSKCDDFKQTIDRKLKGNIDFAMLKFCYIDISEQSDVDAIFDHYRHTMDTLKSDHPEIAFIHITAPLRHCESGFGVWVRELLGRPNRCKLANIKRQAFNDLLLATYKNDPLFDLAASESTAPDGQRETFEYGGKTYYGLIGRYTDDGGHLNEEGRGKVALDFIHTLAAIVSGRHTQ